MLLLPFHLLALALAPVISHAIPPSPSQLHASSEPTCIAGPPLSLPISLLPHHVASHPTSLASFPSDCLLAMHALLDNPRTSQPQWIWKRFPPGASPPRGYAPLPYTVAPASCTVELDVLSDVTAEDQFALQTLKGALIRLFEKCVRGKEGGGVAAGFIVVGPRREMALALKPTPAGWGRVGGGGGEGIPSELKEG